MIRIKDTRTKEVWEIREKGDKGSDGNLIKNDNCYIIPLSGYKYQSFLSIDEAVAWIGKQIMVRRNVENFPRPRTFWSP
jgi:hypothetical protein